MENPYVPNLAVIKDVKDLTFDTKLFMLSFKDKNVEEKFSYKPGQFAVISVLKEGECPISIASSLTRNKYPEFAIKKMGKVTTAMHNLETGDVVGIRGPYGNGFPVEEWVNKNIVLIGGGIGQAPLRSVTHYILDNRKKYGDMHIIHGAKSQNDLVFKNELFEMERMEDVNVYLSIDKEEEGWDRFVGFVPDNLLEVKPSPKNAVAVTCGPPVMINLVIKNLLKMGFKDEQIYTTLEMRMKCGIGKCGRCNIGSIYVCKDGPVFSYKQLKGLQGER